MRKYFYAIVGSNDNSDLDEEEMIFLTQRSTKFFRKKKPSSGCTVRDTSSFKASKASKANEDLNNESKKPSKGH